MTRYEYKVCPAPTKGRKGAGVKGPEARFAHGLEQLMNDMGADGWEYQRSDILPSEERQGLTSSHTVYRSVLVFRRTLEESLPDQATDTKAKPEVVAPQPETADVPAPKPEEPGEPDLPQNFPEEDPADTDQSETAPRAF